MHGSPFEPPTPPAPTGPVPVVHRGTVLGHARTRAGALRVARSLHCAPFEHRTARLAEWWADTGTTFEDRGPAWFVGVALGR